MSLDSQSLTRGTPPPLFASELDAQDSRGRLLHGIALAVAAKGYAATTIADIVASARVSRRTFYQHFSGKEACFSALYIAASTHALTVLRDAVSDDLPWQVQVERAILAYFETLAEDPGRARTLYIEVLRMGAPGLVLRRAVHARFAHWIVEAVGASRVASEAEQAMMLSLAEAVVGGIHELVLKAIEGDTPVNLAPLVAPASRLVRAVFKDAIAE